MLLVTNAYDPHDASVFFSTNAEYYVMAQTVEPRSSTLLLLRLSACPTDGQAWGDFVRRYSGSIYQWCRRYGLQDADAQDVTQEVFAGVLRAVQTFDRSRGRVRAWLFKVVANEVYDWCHAPTHRQEKGTEAARHALASEPAGRELKVRLSEEFDLELLEVAENGVQLQVKADVWASYVLRCKEGVSLRRASAQIGIPAGHVSKYAIRVREMVAKRVVLLEDGSAGYDEVTDAQREHVPADGDVA